MRKTLSKSFITACILFGISGSLKAQLPAYDFTVTDLNGTQHHLFQYLNQGKLVVLDFMEAQCGPCQMYHMTGALNNLYNHYGPNGSILPNQAMVLMLDVWEETTVEHLNGNNFLSYNWVAETDYPVIDLQPETYPAQNQILQAYQSWGTPTIVKICPEDNKKYTIDDLSAYTTDQSFINWFNGPSCKNIVAGYQDHFDLESNLTYQVDYSSNQLIMKGQLSGSFTVKIYNSYGQMVQEETISNFNEEELIQLNGLSTGIYSVVTISDKSACAQSLRIF